MFENGPSDRMQFAGMGELTHPGCCMVCGNGTREEGYVRLGVYYEYEGEMYLCALCLKQAAEIIGCLIPEEAELIQSQNEKLAAEFKVTSEELDKANERLAAYDSMFADVFSNAPGAGSVASVSVSTEPDNGNVASEESAEGPTESESESPKPTPVRRRGNVSKPTEANRSDAISI